MMATFFKNYVELDKTVKNLVEQYRQAKTPENVVRLTYEKSVVSSKETRPTSTKTGVRKLSGCLGG